MSDMSDELTRSAIQELHYEIEKLQSAVYGDRKEPPNGRGLYGQVSRLRAEMAQAGTTRDEKIQGLEQQMDQIIDRLGPKWKEQMVVAGGVFMGVVAFLQIILFWLLYQVLTK